MVFLKQLGGRFAFAALETGREPKGDYPSPNLKAELIIKTEDWLREKNGGGTRSGVIRINLAMFPRWEKYYWDSRGAMSRLKTGNKSLITWAKPIPMCMQ